MCDFLIIPAAGRKHIPSQRTISCKFAISWRRCCETRHGVRRQEASDDRHGRSFFEDLQHLCLHRLRAHDGQAKQETLTSENPARDQTRVRPRAWRYFAGWWSTLRLCSVVASPQRRRESDQKGNTKHRIRLNSHKRSSEHRPAAARNVEYNSSNKKQNQQP